MRRVSTEEFLMKTKSIAFGVHATTPDFRPSRDINYRRVLQNLGRILLLSLSLLYLATALAT